MIGKSGILRRVLASAAHHGLNLPALLNLRHVPAFWADIRRYRQLAAKGDMPFAWRNLLPILNDKTASAGTSASHYFIMDLWMARRVVAAKPKRHVDVGSRLDGFLAHVLASGLPVTMVDIRPLPQPPAGLSFVCDDATKLARFAGRSVASLSSLHAAEHFGLGRYGDAVEPGASVAFMRSLARVLAPGGRLYFAVPVGRERVEFNAHRIFSPLTIEKVFSDAGLTAVERSIITTPGKLVAKPDWRRYLNEEYACGLWVFTRAAGRGKNKR
jgi:hypothetical protein